MPVDVGGERRRNACRPVDIVEGDGYASATEALLGEEGYGAGCGALLSRGAGAVRPMVARAKVMTTVKVCILIVDKLG